MIYGPDHIITIEYEDGSYNYEVEHDSCAAIVYDDPDFGSGKYYVCGVQHELDAIG